MTAFVVPSAPAQRPCAAGTVAGALRGCHESFAQDETPKLDAPSQASTGVLLTTSMVIGGIAGSASRGRWLGRRRNVTSSSRLALRAAPWLKARDRIDGHGWVKQDPDFDAGDRSAYGAVVSVEMKKRPMGVTRFTHGTDGKGARIAEMNEKSRYPGDPRGQCAVGGVKPGSLVKSIGGQDVIGWDFVDIMDLLEDFEPNYNTTQDAKAAWDARPRKHQPIALPAVVEYVEFTVSDTPAAAAPKLEGKWYPRASGFSDQELAAELSRAKQQFPVPADYNGVRYAGPSSLNDAWIKSFMQQQKTGVLLPKAMAYELVIDLIKLQRQEKTMMEINVPVGQGITICGDTHGQYFDVVTLLETNGLPSPSNPYIFNGDFVDRGSWSVENILLLYALKVQNPAFMHFNRGNHELIEANLIYGFCGECFKKYDGDLFNLFSESFRLLSLCALINKEAFVCHAGLPGPVPRLWLPGQSHDPEDAIPVNVSATTLDQIAKVDRYTELQETSYKNCVKEDKAAYDASTDKDTSVIIDLLWGDPRGGAGYGPSYRKGRGIFMFGPDVTEKFCKDNNLSMVIRSHEMKEKGWKQDHEKLWTVFSAPDYMDTGGNQGGYLKVVNEGGKLKIHPHSIPKTPHPPLPPMIYQQYMNLVNPHLTRKMKKQTGIKYDKDGNIVGQVAVEQGDDDFVQQGMTDVWVEDDAAAGDAALTQEQIDAAFAKICQSS
eukprot:TRINITY_DN16630_c0_g1_i1.p1 TRINITY_DN16630_c0_g1~~TRINITY_DN16630_c0_g1_i1.p1  ORF type:complete len:716 (+),score=131.72 TRINITY_DN16630_c0_g1_i1:32-2179(+)